MQRDVGKPLVMPGLAGRQRWLACMSQEIMCFLILLEAPGRNEFSPTSERQ